MKRIEYKKDLKKFIVDKLVEIGKPVAIWLLLEEAKAYDKLLHGLETHQKREILCAIEDINKEHIKEKGHLLIESRRGASGGYFLDREGKVHVQKKKRAKNSEEMSRGKEKWDRKLHIEMHRLRREFDERIDNFVSRMNQI